MSTYDFSYEEKYIISTFIKAMLDEEHITKQRKIIEYINLQIDSYIKTSKFTVKNDDISDEEKSITKLYIRNIFSDEFTKRQHIIKKYMNEQMHEFLE